jgi:hypothetical protein
MGQLIAGFLLAPLLVLGGLALIIAVLSAPGLAGVLLMFALPIAYLTGLFLAWPLLGHLWEDGRFTRRNVLRSGVLLSLPWPAIVALGKPPGSLQDLLGLALVAAFFCGIGWAIAAVFWSVGIDDNERFAPPGAAPDAMPAPPPGSAPPPPTPEG